MIALSVMIDVGIVGILVIGTTNVTKDAIAIVIMNGSIRDVSVEC